MIFQEAETIELKRIVVDDLKKEIIAFANCHGGKIYIGVNDDGTVCGLDNLDESALQISNMIRDSIKPDITLFVRYETLCINNKNVLMLDIQEGCENHTISQKRDYALKVSMFGKDFLVFLLQAP